MEKDPNINPAISTILNTLTKNLSSDNQFRIASYKEKIKWLIVHQFDFININVEEVAKGLGISVYSLRTELRKEGLTFRRLNQDIKIELATRLITVEEISTEEIALYLGFSKVEYFQKAYKRWTGLTIAKVPYNKTIEKDITSAPLESNERLSQKAEETHVDTKREATKESDQLAENNVKLTEELIVPSHLETLPSTSPKNKQKESSTIAGRDSTWATSIKTGRAGILIIDDEEVIRSTLQEILEYEDYETEMAADGQEGLDCILKNDYDVILCDIKMPRLNGIEVLEKALQAKPDIPFVMISGHADIETAVEATKKGAYDFLEKPPDLNRLLVTLRNAVNKSDLVTETKKLKRKITRTRKIIGKSPEIKKIQETIEKVALSDANVLLIGETGTGKSLIADWIHEKSIRAVGPFVHVNCAAIIEGGQNTESLLFGHEKGSFTGAYKKRAGKFEQAHGGTLFLEGIDSMSIKTQAKLLDAIEHKRITPIGSNKKILLDTRIICAVSKDLMIATAEREFRDDLYYRISEFTIKIPPLRDRREDIPFLVNMFLAELHNQLSWPSLSIEDEAVDFIKKINYPFYGNIRELRNILYSLTISSNGAIKVEDVRNFFSSKGNLFTREQKAINKRYLKQPENFDNREKKASSDILEKVMRPILHDLKNHLYMISEKNKQVRKCLELDELTSDNELLKHLEDQNKRTRLANMDLNRLRSLKGFTVSKKVDLDVLDLLLSIAALFQVHNIEIEDLLPKAKKYWVHGNKDQLSMLFGNLIENAIQAMPNGGKIILSSEIVNDQQSEIIIKIEDNGIGIKSDLLPNIFEKNVSTKGDGHGTGLDLVKKITNSHGGEVTIDSEHKVGTSVYIKLPIVKILK